MAKGSAYLERQRTGVPRSAVGPGRAERLEDLAEEMMV
jgi:hypothetical protein